MSQDSRIIYKGFDNSQDFWSNNNQRDDNDFKSNSPLSNDIWNNEDMNIQSSPTFLNNNNLSDSLSNHSFLSRKIKRNEDEDSENPFKNCRLKNELEEEEGSNDKISENSWINKPSDSLLDKYNKALMVNKINYPTEKEVKEIIKCFLLAFTTIKDLNKFLNTSWRDILSKYDSSLIYTLSDELLETCQKDYIE